MAKKSNIKNSASSRTQAFTFAAPDATNVQLVGDFTQWQERPIQMERGADGTWRTTVILSPGAHYYRFLVDGQWCDDPDCPVRTPNPFGSENMMRQVA
jgi:1,4-alpha-glucan branching enzyme